MKQIVYGTGWAAATCLARVSSRSCHGRGTLRTVSRSAR